MISKEQLLIALKTAGEPTRLRLMVLCAEGELSVSELTDIVGQSQPRVSRHLKMLVEAGLLERFREGSMVFYRLSEHNTLGDFAHEVVARVPGDDPEQMRDIKRLAQVKHNRASRARQYFSENAERWSQIRSLHVREDEVESALKEVIGDQAIDDFLDIGTGTGRILVLMSRLFRRGVGLDISQAMLTVARTSFEQQGIKNTLVRMGDMYSMPIESESIDVSTLHQVLHYSEEPERVVQEAARVLRSQGRLFIIDFASHHEESLRNVHQHYRLGFSDEEVIGYLTENGLKGELVATLKGEPLTVKIWKGIKV